MASSQTLLYFFLQVGLMATSVLCYLIGFIVNEGLPTIRKVAIVFDPVTSGGGLPPSLA